MMTQAVGSPAAKRRVCAAGFALLEVLISIALLGIVAVVFLGAVGTGDRAAITEDQRVMAESLARRQLEALKSDSYIDYAVGGHPLYPAISAPASYSVSLVATPVDPATLQSLPAGQDQGMQDIAVTVSRTGSQLTTLHDLKVSR